MRTQPIRLPGRVLPLWTLGGGQLPGVQSRGSYNFRVARIASEDRRYLMVRHLVATVQKRTIQMVRRVKPAALAPLFFR